MKRFLANPMFFKLETVKMMMMTDRCTCQFGFFLCHFAEPVCRIDCMAGTGEGRFKPGTVRANALLVFRIFVEGGKSDD